MDDFQLVQSKVTLLGAAEDLMLQLPKARTVLCPCDPTWLRRSPKTNTQPWQGPPCRSWRENRQGPCFRLALQTAAVGCENK